jgi:hypothetical protein
VTILHAKWEKKTNLNISDLAFQKSFENGGVEIPDTESPSEISAITKSTAGVAFLTPWK